MDENFVRMHLLSSFTAIRNVLTEDYKSFTGTNTKRRSTKKLSFVNYVLIQFIFAVASISCSCNHTFQTIQPVLWCEKTLNIDKIRWWVSINHQNLFKLSAPTAHIFAPFYANCTVFSIHICVESSVLKKFSTFLIVVLHYKFVIRFLCLVVILSTLWRLCLLLFVGWSIGSYLIFFCYRISNGWF